MKSLPQLTVLGYRTADGRVYAPEDVEVVYADRQCRRHLAGRLKDTWDDRRCVLPLGHPGACRMVCK